MLALIVTLDVKPEHRDAVMAGMLEDARGSQHDEPGCLRFDVVQDDKDPNRFYFYEVYRDEAAFQAHLKAPHFPAFRDLPQEYYTQATRVARGPIISPKHSEYR